MKKSKKAIKITLLASVAFGPLILIGSTFASWAVTDNADELNLKITAYAPGLLRVNYYLPKSDGSGFELDSSEALASGEKLSHVPTPGNIENYTFEKWSTTDTFADSVDTNATVTSDLNLYAGYYGYEAKGASDSSYTLLPATTGSVSRLKYNGTNDEDTAFSYSYALLGTDARNSRYISSDRFQGTSIGVYKTYFCSSVHSLIESKNNKVSDGYFKIYFNPTASSGSKIYFTRTFVLELQNFDGWVNLYAWNSGDGNVKNSWPGNGMNWLGGGGDNYYKRYYYFDIDTSKIDKFIAAGGYNNAGQSKQTPDLSFPTNSVDNCYYCYRYDEGSYGWFNFGDTGSSLYGG